MFHRFDFDRIARKSRTAIRRIMRGHFRELITANDVSILAHFQSPR